MSRQTLQVDSQLLTLDRFAATSRQVADRINAEDAQENLRVLEQTGRLLHTNVQEALALEVGFLKLKLG